MAVDGIGASAGETPFNLSRSADEPAPPEQRALVPVADAGSRESHGSYSRRPTAPFLAQLIATARGELQTRERRRADPDAAAQAYAATLHLSRTEPQKS